MKYLKKRTLSHISPTHQRSLVLKGGKKFLCEEETLGIESQEFFPILQDSPFMLQEDYLNVRF